MTAAEREGLILSLAEKVEIIARRQRRLLPPGAATIEELISIGWVGAIQAVDRFDPKRSGASLATFASQRIHGALLDWMRSQDPLSRAHRAAVKKGEQPGVVTISLDQPIKAVVSKSGDKVLPSVIAKSEIAAIDAAIMVEQLIDGAKLKRSKSGRRGLTVMKRVVDGESGADIARDLGVVPCRVSQIYRRTLGELRAAA